MKENTKKLVQKKERKLTPELKADLKQFISTLELRGIWLPAQSFNMWFGWSPRYTRLLRSMAKGRIISGNDGYKAVQHTTPEEVSHFVKKTYSAGKEMIKQSLEASRYYTGINPLTRVVVDRMDEDTRLEQKRKDICGLETGELF